MGTSLAVQWLRLRASTAGGMGSISGWGTKIPHATWCPHPPPPKAKASDKGKDEHVKKKKKKKCDECTQWNSVEHLGAVNLIGNYQPRLIVKHY